MAAKTTDQKARAKAYNRAQTRLREAHADEWQTILGEEYEAVGIEYKPRLSPEQKAKVQIEALLAEFPSLKYDIPL